jgi:peptide/nickel transport system permease protein
VRLAAAWAAALAATGALAWLAARAGGPADEHAGPWRLALARFRRNRAAVAAACVLVALYVIAALAPWLAPHDPIAQPDILALKNQPPSLAHPFGTDFASRDVLSRVLLGSRVSLGVALLAVLVAITVGTAYGAVAGFRGGRADAVMMRAVDVALAIPRLLLLLAVFALWRGVSVPTLVLVLGLTGWFGVSRLVRAQVRAAAAEEWATAARALGVSERRLLWRHIVPNSLSPVIVAATLGVGNVIILESGLAFLGLGLPAPAPTWGGIIQDGRGDLSLWWMAVFPGAAIVLTVLAFNIAGDGVRDALDPRGEVGSGKREVA